MLNRVDCVTSRVCGSDDVGLVRLGNQRHCGLCLTLSPGLLRLGEAGSHVVRIIKQPEEWPTVQELRFPANSQHHVSDPFWKHIFQAQ